MTLGSKPTLSALDLEKARADARLQDPNDTTYFYDGTHTTDLGNAVFAEHLNPVLARMLSV